jgi:hypothetical protein
LTRGGNYAVRLHADRGERMIVGTGRLKVQVNGAPPHA